MGKAAKRRQQDPQPLEKPERTAKTVRSGGKRKRVDANGNLIKPAKAPATDKKTKKSSSKPVGESEGSDDEDLDAARAAFFDEEDLDEEAEAGGFEGREDDLALDGSEDEFEGAGEGSEADSFDLEDDPLEGEAQPGLDSDM